MLPIIESSTLVAEFLQAGELAGHIAGKSYIPDLREVVAGLRLAGVKLADIIKGLEALIAGEEIRVEQIHIGEGGAVVIIPCNSPIARNAWEDWQEYQQNR
jgi:hypothetical protein